MPASFQSSTAVTSVRLACSPPATFEPVPAIAGNADDRKQRGAAAVLPQLVLGAIGSLTGGIGSREPTQLEQRVARILSNKRVTELYLSWMPWQQSALLAGILDRCPTDQLTMIYKAVGRPAADLLQSAGKSSAKSSGSSREAQLARAKQLQRELSRAIDAVFNHRKSWRKQHAQRQRQKVLSAAERSYAARTDLYRYVDPARFSLEIERALCNLLRQSGVAFTYGSAAGSLAVDIEPRVPPTSMSVAGAAAALPDAGAWQQSLSVIHASATPDQESVPLAAAPALLGHSGDSGGSLSLTASELQAEWSSPSDAPPLEETATAAAVTGSAAAAYQPPGPALTPAELSLGDALCGDSSELLRAESDQPGHGGGLDLPLVTTHDLPSLQQGSTIVQPLAVMAVDASPTKDGSGTPGRHGSRRVSAAASRDPTIGRFSSDVMTAVMTKGGPNASYERISEIVAETILATATDLGLYDSQADHLSLSPARAQQLKERISGDVAVAVLRHHHIHVLQQLQQQGQEPTGARRLPAGALDSHKMLRKQAGKRPTVAADKLLHRVAKHAVHKPVAALAAAPRSFFQMPPATPEPSQTTITSSSKHSATTLDYFPDRPLQKYGGLCRGVASASGGSSVDVSIPLQATYKSVKFSYGINEEFLVRPNRKKLAAVYHSQLHEIWQAIETWRPSDIMTLVVDLVKASSEDILAMLRAVLSAKCRLARNINDLPDRLLLRIFKLLDPDDLEGAQEVCQQWHYLCSRPEVWMQKCDELGALLGLPRLSTRLRSEALPEHDEATIDWKLCYYELERLLHRSGRYGAAGASAAAAAAAAALAGSAAAAAATAAALVTRDARGVRPSHRAAQHRMHLPTAAAAGVTATATALPGFDSPVEIVTEASAVAAFEGAELQACPVAQRPLQAELPTAAAAATEAAGHKRVVRHKLKPVQIAPLSVTSNNQLMPSGRNDVKIDKTSSATSAVTAVAFVATNAERSTPCSRDDFTRQALAAPFVHAKASTEAEELLAQKQHLAPSASGVRVPEAATRLRGQPSVTALPTVALPSERDQLDAAADRNRYAVAQDSMKIRESSSSSGLGIEVLAKKKIMLQAGEVALDIRTTLKPVKNLANNSQGMERNSDSPLLEWADPDSCNLRDPAIQKRCKAIVKEVCCVRRFQGHLDCINCVAFDKRRAFTGGADHVIFMWDLYSGQLVRQMLGHTGSVRCLQLDSKRNVLYSGSWDESIIVWDVIKFKSIALLLGHEGVITCLKLSRDGLILVSASTDSTVRMWSTTTYNCQRLLRSFSDHSPLGCLWFDGLLLAAGGEEGVLRVYDCSALRLDREYYCTTSAAAAATGASAGVQNLNGGNDQDTSGSSNLLDQQSATELSKSQAVTSVTIVNDLVVAGLSGGELCCWDRLSAQVVARFSIHRGSVVATLFCYGRLLTAGSDGLVKEWELGTMACVRVLRGHQSAIRAMEVREGDDRIVTVGEDKLVHVWDLRQRKKPPAPTSTDDDHQSNKEQALHTWLPVADDNQK